METDTLSNQYKVSQSSAREVALTFFSERNLVSPTRGIVSDNERSFSFYDFGEPYAHFVNFSEGGFVIIAGDRRIEPILAYSETGSIDADSAYFPEGFKIWLNDIKLKTRYIRDNNIEDKSTLISSLLWKKFSPSFETRSVPIDTSSTPLIDTTVGPLIQTSWHDSSPYNRYLPSYLDTTEFVIKHYWAGSSTVAIAKLMHYYNYPNSFSWNAMPLSLSNSDTTDYSALFNLYLNVYNEIDSYKGFNIIDHVARVKETFNLNSFLKIRYGYSSAKQKSYSKHVDYQIIKSELLDHYRPVILSGNSNISGRGRQYWICDGVHEYYEIIDLNDGTQTRIGHLYFHHSWGDIWFPPTWLTFSDFSAGTISSITFTFSDNMRIVYEIIP